MSRTKTAGRHRTTVTARRTAAKRAAGTAVVGAAMSAGLIGGLGTGTAVAAPCTGLFCDVVGGGSQLAIGTLNAVPGTVVGVDEGVLSIGNALTAPILGNPLTLVRTGASSAMGSFPGRTGDC
jgi:hypothetical protein